MFPLVTGFFLLFSKKLTACNLLGFVRLTRTIVLPYSGSADTLDREFRLGHSYVPHVWPAQAPLKAIHHGLPRPMDSIDNTLLISY